MAGVLLRAPTAAVLRRALDGAHKRNRVVNDDNRRCTPKNALPGRCLARTCWGPRASCVLARGAGGETERRATTTGGVGGRSVRGGVGRDDDVSWRGVVSRATQGSVLRWRLGTGDARRKIPQTWHRGTRLARVRRRGLIARAIMEPPTYAPPRGSVSFSEVFTAKSLAPGWGRPRDRALRRRTKSSLHNPHPRFCWRRKCWRELSLHSQQLENRRGKMMVKHV